MEQAEAKGLALALITALISGISVFANGIAVKLADPVAYTILKNMGALVFLAAIVMAAGGLKHFRTLSRRQWGMLALIGVIGGSVPFAMFFWGLKLGGAAVSSFIFRSLFVFAGVFGYLLLRERPKPLDVAAGFTILIGNALLVSGDMAFGAGQLLVLGATLLWALEYTISRKVLSEVNPRTVMVSRMLFGSAALIAFMGFGGTLGSLAQVDAPALMWLAVTSLLLAGFMASWYCALKFLPVLRAASILALGGVVTAALECIFSGAAVTSMEILGLGLVSLGVVLALGFPRLLGYALQSRQESGLVE